MSAVTIRWATPADIPALIDFFRKAYGKDSIFSSAQFLQWYFGSESDSGHLLSIIAVTPAGHVAAHYGGIRSDLLLDNLSLPMVWGISAFTLPEHRGEGLGGTLVQFLMGKYDVFGVIGFAPETAQFYSENGFHVFNRNRFHRHVAMLRPEGWELASTVGADESRLREALGGSLVRSSPVNTTQVQVLARDAVPSFSFPLLAGIRLTMGRAPEFLQWRFRTFAHPRYEILQWTSRKAEQEAACVVARRERIEPTPQWITRIVDLYGQVDGVELLLSFLNERCRERGDSFVDCSLFGSYYQTAMENCGFCPLRNDDAALLPQVTHPAEPRPNHEYMGLFSQKYGKQIMAVPYEEVHFTRMSSDRDRLSKLDQLHTPEEKH